MNSAVHQPISWLAMERYHLGQLADDEQRRIEAHLRSCAECHAVLSSIEQDQRMLPPLVLEERRTAWWRQPFVLAPAGVLAAATLVLVLVAVLRGLPPRESSLGAVVPPGHVAWKGGELALTLVRERDGSAVEDAAVYVDGDRFKLLVTCSETKGLRYDVAVYQDGETFFPLETRSPLSCGNNVPLPGAFQVSGQTPITVCLVTGESLPSRAELSAQGRVHLPQGAVCAIIQPAGK